MVLLTQCTGEVLELASKPQNIISLVPSITENLILFGKLPAARTSFCIEPADIVKGIPVIGGTKTPRVSKIISMKPDLVIANQEENIKEHIEEIRAAGIPVWVTFPMKVYEMPRLMMELSSLCEDEELFSPWITMSEKLLTREYKWEKTPKIATLIWKKPWMAVGHDTYTSDLIHFCGAKNPIFGRYPEISVELIEQVKPDILLLPTEPYAFEKEDFVFWQKHVPQVIGFSGEDLLWSGTRWISAVSQLVEICKHFVEKSLK